MLEIFFRYFFIVPLILLIVTVILIVNSSNKLKHYEQCTGVITGFYENKSAVRVDVGETKAVSPIVSYQVDGRQYQFTANYYSTNMKVGQEVKVLYNMDDHSKASIQTGLYVGPLITGCLTLFFIIPVVVFAVLRSKGILNF